MVKGRQPTTRSNQNVSAAEQKVTCDGNFMEHLIEMIDMIDMIEMIDMMDMIDFVF